eukprot:gene28012-31109_t
MPAANCAIEPMQPSVADHASGDSPIPSSPTATSLATSAILPTSSMVSVSQEFISIGCNRVVNALDWGDHGYVAYGGHFMTVVYDPKAAKVVSTLVGHTGQVNCVMWVPSTLTPQLPKGSALLLSGSTDANIRVWLVQGLEDLGSSAAVSSTCIATLQGHAGPVTSLSVYPVDKDTFMLASSAGDEAVRTWSCTASSGGGMLLATGGTDSTVYLYVRPPGGEFSLSCKLTGHENWVRSISFCHVANTTDSGAYAGQSTELLLASASQDRYGRIWRVCLAGMDASSSVTAEDPLAAMIARYAPKPTIIANNVSYIKCELTMPQAVSGLWMNEAAIGDAGASCLGYFGGVYSPDAQFLMAHGFTGALHLREQQTSSSSVTTWVPRHALGRREGALHLWERQTSSSSVTTWVPRHALGGHFGAVKGACWGVDGKCLMTVSTDQTARMFTTVGTQEHWCEMARMQVHGHDFTCLANVPCPPSASDKATPSTFMFVSGSEEKILRAFEAPQAFLDTLDMARGREAGTTAAEQGFSTGGAGGMGDGYNEGPDLVPSAAPSAVSGPPLEEHLSQNTLWPEVHKLYGHGNDVFCVAASPDGKYIASACVAKQHPSTLQPTPSTAAVWVWRTSAEGWRPVTQLQVHSLTVTHLSWSHDGVYLLACSRDRSCSLFQRSPVALATEDPKLDDDFTLLYRVKGAHARVIWGASWSPDDALLATGARDGCVKIWRVGTTNTGGAAEVGQGGEAPPAMQLALTLPVFPSAVTAVAFAECPMPVGASGEQGCLLAVGLESGEVQVWSVRGGSGGGGESLVVEGACMWSSGEGQRHTASINALCWTAGDKNGSGMRLASVGDDHSLRVFSCICG